MIIFDVTRPFASGERPVAAGSTITAEGQALVNDVANGGVKPSTGASTDQFVGLSLNQQMTILYLPYFETKTAPVGGGTITLSKTNLLSGSVRVYDVTAGAAMTIVGGAPAAATEVQISSLAAGTIVTHTGAGNHILTVSYRYSPSTVEAQMVQGDIPPGGAASLYLGNTGVIFSGSVTTDQYDTAADWSGLPIVRVGANGLLTTTGSGAVVPGCVVETVPSVGNPYLTVRF